MKILEEASSFRFKKEGKIIEVKKGDIILSRYGKKIQILSSPYLAEECDSIFWRIDVRYENGLIVEGHSLEYLLREEVKAEPIGFRIDVASVVDVYAEIF